MELNQPQKNSIIKFMQNMSYSTWTYLNKFTQDEQAYIIWLCQNQSGCQFECDGMSYITETHTKFRRLDSSFISKFTTNQIY